MQKRPYRERRAALEALFAQQGLRGTWTLCPSTTDPQLAQEWLNWSAAGMEGLVFKPLNSRYTPTARGWQKYKVKHTTEAVIGGVSGSLTDPRTILLGRYDSTGRLQYVGRTTVLSRGVSPTWPGIWCAPVTIRAGTPRRSWSSPWSCRSWWPRSAPTSPWTKPAGGATL
jgi:hypothetical protein